jgi:hypothetical protein
MRIKIYVILSVLAIITISCSSITSGISPTAINGKQIIPTKTSGETESRVTQEITAIPTATIENASTISGINLEFRAFLQDNAEDIGNGMKRITIFVDGKNASNQWSSYSISAFDNCNWGGGMNPPILETKQGYSYDVVWDNSASCGPKYIPDDERVPPGASFAYIGDDFNSNPNFFAWMMFDIPQNATPMYITFNYYARLSEGEQYGSHSEAITAQVLTMSAYTPISDLIDPQYGLKIYKIGDEIGIGDLAKIRFQKGSEATNGTYNIQLIINSIDEGYPIQIWSSSHTYLLYQDGVICCKYYPEDWGFEPSENQQNGPIIGPLQSSTYEKNIDLRNGKVWIIGDIEIREARQNSQFEEQLFVLQIP